MLTWIVMMFNLLCILWVAQQSQSVVTPPASLGVFSKINFINELNSSKMEAVRVSMTLITKCYVI